MSQPYYLDPCFAPLRRRYGAGETVIRQGATDGHVCILLSGALEIARDNRTVGRLEAPGALVGEMSLILGSPYTATVTALQPSELVVMPRAELKQYAGRIPEFSLLLMRTVAQRLEQTNARLSELEDRYDALYNRLQSAMHGEDEAAPAAEEAGVRPADTAVIQTGKRPALMEKLASCPAHEGHETFPLFLLRTGSQHVTTDAYGVCEYTAPEAGFEPVDYTLLEVQVCPVCLFASSQWSDFAVQGAPSTGLSVRRTLRAALAESLAARRAVCGRLADARALHGRRRGAAEAAAAYELGILTARCFFDLDPGLYSAWGFRIALYHLKRAQVCRRHGGDEGADLARAYELVQQALGRFSGAQCFHACFLTVALAQRLEGTARATEHQARFDKIRNQVRGRLDPRLRTACDDYYLKAKACLGAK